MEAKKEKKGDQERYRFKGSEFHGRSLCDKSSLFIEQIPKRYGDSDLKAWQAVENTEGG